MDKKHGFEVVDERKRDNLGKNMEKEWISISRAIFDRSLWKTLWKLWKTPQKQGFFEDQGTLFS